MRSSRVVTYSIAGIVLALLLSYLGWSWFDLNYGTSPAVQPTSGLGLSRQTWEQEHGTGEEIGTDGWRRYAQKRGDNYTVAFWYGRVSRLTYQWDPAFRSDIDKTRESTTIIRAPSDSVLVRTYTPRENTTVDVYTSAWLQQQFSTTNPSFYAWADAPPGTFIAVYQEEAGQIASVTLMLGDNP